MNVLNRLCIGRVARTRAFDRHGFPHAAGTRRQHDDAVGEIGRLLDVVRHEQDRLALGPELLDRTNALALELRVAHGEDLVHQLRGAAGGPAWPKYELKDEAVMEFSSTGPVVRNHLFNARHDYVRDHRKQIGMTNDPGMAPYFNANPAEEGPRTWVIPGQAAAPKAAPKAAAK